MLPVWLRAVEAQSTDSLDLTVACFDDHSTDGTPDLLRDAGVTVLSEPAWRSPLSDVEAVEHCWSREAYAHMARMRNRLAEHAAGTGCDFVLTLDSDVILADDQIGRLLEGVRPGEVVAPLVNVARRRHHIAWNYLFWVADNLAVRPPPEGWLPFDGRYQVGVVCAAYLIPADRMVRWEAHRQGEDAGWSANARHAGLRVLVDTRELARHVAHRRVLA